MALARRSGARFQSNIWPGFVDAMTALLLVLMFVLTIFMIVQFMLREEITGQETELTALTAQVASLADALGLEQSRTAQLQSDLERISATLADAEEKGAEQAALIARLTADLNDSRTEGERLTARVDALETEVGSLEDTLASARQEIDEQAEAARLAAARREALDALIADLRRRNQVSADEVERLGSALTEEQAASERLAMSLLAEQQEAARLAEALSEEEKARLAEAEAARLLREKLAGAEDELTAVSLALEEERKRAEETLTLLAAAETARAELSNRVDELSTAEAEAALLAVAQQRLAEQESLTEESQQRVALLNQQINSLRSQLAALQGLLDAAEERDREAKVQIEALGSDLNTALAQVAAEQRRRAELEEAERKRLEEEARALQAEAEELERYRSEFFGRLRDLMAGREGVRVVGDRFVFSSEVLFQPGSADLAPEGRAQIASVAALLAEVAQDIPTGVDWILRVDGHTDNVPLAGGGRYADNWELSQARALSVVRYLTDELGFPPERLAATGFGEYRPVADVDTPEARAQNRRIELKLTER